MTTQTYFIYSITWLNKHHEVERNVEVEESAEKLLVMLAEQTRIIANEKLEIVFIRVAIQGSTDKYGAVDEATRLKKL